MRLHLHFEQPLDLTQAVNGFLAKAGGKDKLTALIQVRGLALCCEGSCLRQTARAWPGLQQLHLTLVLPPQYAAMFVSAGEPGNAKKVQVSVAAARKVFRVFGVRVSPTARSQVPCEQRWCLCCRDA